MLVIQDKSFANTWASLVQEIMHNGQEYYTEYNELAKYITAYIKYNRSSIEEMERLELHPQFPTRTQHLLSYLFQFNEKEGSKYNNFTYTYFLRLKGQLDEIVKRGLKVNSRRNIGITWRIEEDLNSTSPPCLIYFSIFRYNLDKCKLYLHWRSRDIYTAYQSNLCALVYMINNSVLQKVNKKLKIYEIYESIDNAHIHKYDWDEAFKIKTIASNPQYYYK